MLMMLGTGAGSRRTKNGTSAMQKSDAKEREHKREKLESEREFHESGGR
jgi:hypothetical protein